MESLFKSEMLNNQVNDFICFCKEKIGIDNSINIIAVHKKQKGNYFGYVDFLKVNKESTNEIVICNNNIGFDTALNYIAHEITHIKQIINNQLSVSSDYKNLFWNDKKIMSISVYHNYVKNKGIEKYMLIPFESEAYFNEQTLLNEYKKTNRYIL